MDFTRPTGVAESLNVRYLRKSVLVYLNGQEELEVCHRHDTRVWTRQARGVGCLEASQRRRLEVSLAGSFRLARTTLKIGGKEHKKHKRHKSSS